MEADFYFYRRGDKNMIDKKQQKGIIPKHISFVSSYGYAYGNLAYRLQLR